MFLIHFYNVDGVIVIGGIPLLANRCFGHCNPSMDKLRSDVTGIMLASPNLAVDDGADGDLVTK